MALRVADDELVVGVSSFEDLYRAYASRVRAVLQNRFRRDDARVDDLVQEVFLRAYRARDVMEPGRDPWPWLCTIAVNIAIDEQRRPQREYSADLLTEPADNGDPWEHYEASERTAAFKAAIGTLPARGRRLVLLKDAAGFDYDELAEADGTTVQALRCAILRARRRLRDSYSAELASRGLAAVTAPFGRLVLPRFTTLQERFRRTAEMGAITGVASPSSWAALVVGAAALLPLAAPSAPSRFEGVTRIGATPAVATANRIPATPAATVNNDPPPARPAVPATPTTKPAGRAGGLPGLPNAVSNPIGDAPNYGIGDGVQPWVDATANQQTGRAALLLRPIS